MVSLSLTTRTYNQTKKPNPSFAQPFIFARYCVLLFLLLSFLFLLYIRPCCHPVVPNHRTASNPQPQPIHSSTIHHHLTNPIHPLNHRTAPVYTPPISRLTSSIPGRGDPHFCVVIFGGLGNFERTAGIKPIDISDLYYQKIK